MIRTLSVSAVILAAIGSGVAVMAADAMPSVSIAAPAMGATFTGKTIPVTVAAKNFTIECTNVGQGMKAGRGHYHVMIDGMSMAQMTNLYCTNSFAVSGAGLRAGEHTLAVVLASDDHVMVGKPAMTKFMYAPKVAQPLPEAAAEKPVVTIVSPKTGSLVSRNVELKVAISGYDLSCNLEGKPNVAGYGHLHVFVMQDAMPMHDMGEMTVRQEPPSVNDECIGIRLEMLVDGRCDGGDDAAQPGYRAWHRFGIRHRHTNALHHD